MLTYTKVNQILKLYHYRVMVLVKNDYWTQDNSVKLIKISDLTHPVAMLYLDDIYVKHGDNCGYQNFKNVPDKVSLIFKHLMTSILNNGLTKVFNHHVIDLNSQLDINGCNLADNNYYYKHDKYIRAYIRHYNAVLAFDNMDSVYSDFIDELRQIKKHHLGNSSYNWGKIDDTVKHLNRLLKLHK